MKIDAILFDINGTLIDILTDEEHLGVYRKVRNFLQYYGVIVEEKEELKELYFKFLKEQKDSSQEKYPEFDAAAIFRKIIQAKQTPYYQDLPREIMDLLPVLTAQLYRSLTLCKKLVTYPQVPEVLAQLHEVYPLAIVTDAQNCYAVPELRCVDLAKYFYPIIVSGDYGYRKPDPRLYQKALDYLRVKPENALFVGNDMHRDVFGAKQLGMKVVLFSSNQGDKTPHGAEPDYIIYQFGELLQAIEWLKKNK